VNSPPGITISTGDQSIARELESKLLASLREELPQSENSAIVLQANHTCGTLIGGLTGGISYGWLLVKVLWVSEAQRGRGLGRALLETAEAHAIKAGCHGAWLDTSNPTAKRFYERLEYEIFGQLNNSNDQTPSGHVRWFMRKALPLARE